MSDDLNPDISESDFTQYPILNEAQMREIFSIDETGEFLKEVLDESMDQALATAQELHEALNEKDFSRIRERAHFLKGSMAQLGLRRLNRICLIMQFYIDKSPFESISFDHLEVLTHQLDISISATLQYLYVTPDKAKINDHVMEILNKN